MRTLLSLLVILWIAAFDANANMLSLGPGTGISLDPKDPPPCNGTLLMNADGTWESAYAIEGSAVAPPDWGGFGEGYEFTGSVCGMQAHLSNAYGYPGYGLADAFVYDSDGENPLSVLSLTVGVEIEDVALWPEVSVHEIELVPANVDGEFFVYLWGNWPGTIARWFYAASFYGSAGRPRIKCLASLGVPEGWHDVSDVFENVIAMGIGAYVSDEPVPTGPSSWGSVKALYRP